MTIQILLICGYILRLYYTSMFYVQELEIYENRKQNYGWQTCVL